MCAYICMYVFFTVYCVLDCSPLVYCKIWFIVIKPGRVVRARPSTLFPWLPRMVVVRRRSLRDRFREPLKFQPFSFYTLLSLLLRYVLYSISRVSYSRAILRRRRRRRRRWRMTTLFFLSRLSSVCGRSAVWLRILARTEIDLNSQNTQTYPYVAPRAHHLLELL